MSRDSHVLLREAEFPKEIWESILLNFPAEQRKDFQWVIDSADGPVWVDCLKLRDNHTHSESYEWCVSLRWQAPYGPSKLWITYALPYRCLLLMGGSAYKSESTNYITSDPKEFEEFANRDILKMTSLQKLSKCGLLNNNERLKLNT